MSGKEGRGWGWGQLASVSRDLDRSGCGARAGLAACEAALLGGSLASRLPAIPSSSSPSPQYGDHHCVLL